jgi:Zn-dependent protease
MFWVVSAILGSNQHDTKLVLVWIGVVFVSVLIHEFGHVLMGKLFGSHGHIVLYGFGGLAIGSNALDKRWQRNFVSFAGPLAQFFLLGLVVLVYFGLVLNHGRQLSPMTSVAFAYFFYVNLFWPILNLLPIWPLDGGRISRETFEWLVPRSGMEISLIVSAMVAGVLAMVCLAAASGVQILPFFFGGLYTGVFFALFAVSNIQEWIMVRRRSRYPWESDETDSW